MTPARCRKVKGRGDEPRTEAPVNGGRNYRQSDRPVVPKTKSGYLLENPVYLPVLALQLVRAVTIRGVRAISRKDSNLCSM